MDAELDEDAFGLSEQKRAEALGCIERARHFQADGDMDGAQREVTNAWYALDEALAVCPLNHRARFLLVSCAMNADDYSRAKIEALRIYHDISEEQLKQLNDSVLHLSIVHSSKMLDEPEDAIKFATEATTLFAEDPQPYMVLGELNMSADNHAEAERRLRQALLHHDSPSCKHPLTPQNVYFTLCCLGAALTSQGKYSEAELFLMKAARQDHASTLALRHLVDVYHFQGRPREALKIAGRICELDPADEEIRRKIAEIESDGAPRRQTESVSGSDFDFAHESASAVYESNVSRRKSEQGHRRPRGSRPSDQDSSVSSPRRHDASRRSAEDRDDREQEVSVGPPMRPRRPDKQDGWFAFCCFDRDDRQG